MTSADLQQMLTLAHQALRRTDMAEIARSASIEDLAALLIACARITGWQGELTIVAAQLRSAPDLTQLHALIRSVREETQQGAALALAPVGGEA